jgi:hypothetical protein
MNSSVHRLALAIRSARASGATRKAGAKRKEFSGKSKIKDIAMHTKENSRKTYQFNANHI